MKIIGITGSSGSGKSTVCEILKQKYLVKIIDADVIAKRLSTKGTKYLAEICKVFGTDILDEQGNLNRRKLASIIYSSAQAREKLNECTFKYIKQEIKQEIESTKENISIIIDAPLLFESGLNEWCSCIIGVISTKELQLQRVVIRDNISYEQAEKRLYAQKANGFYKKNCDMLIQNNNNISEIKEQIDVVAQKCNITKNLQ